jgi:alkylation response protein AidB-like acyl-CoA dehydrogenase
VDFGLDDQQRLLRDSTDRLARSIGLSAGHGADAWPQLAELGVLGLGSDEEEGGYGGGPVETMIVAEALGRGMAFTPYVAGLVLPVAMLRKCATAAQRASLVPSMADGSLRLAAAHQEPGVSFGIDDIRTTARRDGDAWVLDGRKTCVFGGDVADMLLVTAQMPRASGLGVFMVDADADGLTRRAYAGIGAMSGADVDLAGVRVAAEGLMAAPGQVQDQLEAAFDVALAANLAECVGTMEAMIALTAAHLADRKQFGTRIGEFQALRHRVAEMLVATERSRGMAMLAASLAESSDREERRKAVSGAKLLVGEALRAVAQAAVQLHGGMGITAEHAVGLCFGRATALESFLGSTEHHLDLFRATAGFIAAHDDLPPAFDDGADRNRQQPGARR